VRAFYWSHAGAHFEMQLLGRWWATLPRARWPPEQVAEIEADFGGGAGGDRRQEIVFIGVSLDAAHRAELVTALDAAMLTDDEMERYARATGRKGDGDRAVGAADALAKVDARNAERELSQQFPNPIEIAMTSYS
jgi:hypothetical protein